jgi:LysM repeat protein
MKKLFFVFMMFILGVVSAQGTRTVSVKVSNQTQTINNKEYYIHIVEQGQTLFSIARAYGLKYYDAVIKTDIHLMKVGDTVWLPKNEYSVAAVTAKANATTDPSNRTRYIKIEAGQTLYGLSREYGVTVEQIVEANPELRNEQLKAGQMIKIPPREEQAKETQKSVQTTPVSNQTTPTNTASQTQKESKTDKSEQSNALTTTETKKDINPSTTERQTAKTTQTETTQVNAGQELSQPVRRAIVNPYPFAEVPSDFPTKKAPYYNFSTPSTFTYQVRDRQDKQRLFVSVVMPLHLSKIDEISTSKFDIEQRGKKDYKVFEFIQFYEGILIALDQLQQQGYNIVLNVVDLTSDKDEDVVEAFNSHSVANSDFIIALLVKKPFQKLAELAKENQVFVINPFSSREDIVKDNPYVVKCMPSVEGTVKGLLDNFAQKHRNGNLYILHSNNKSNNSDEKAYHEEMQKQLEKRKDIKYTFIDWSANAKLVPALKSTSDNVILSIYDVDRNKNTVFATTLLNRLSPLAKPPVLVTTYNYITEYPNVDFEQLQKVKYTTVTTGYLDYSNTKHKNFIDTYKDKFRTEPNTLYAGVAHDIMIYFCTALHQRGAEFWRNPDQFKSPSEMLFPFSLRQHAAGCGYENQSIDLYQMLNFKLVKSN